MSSLHLGRCFLNKLKRINHILTLPSTYSSYHHTNPSAAMLSNQAAWIDEKGAPLRVADAPFPIAGPGEIIIESRAVAINPLDWHMQDWGVFIQQWPSIFGCDVAGLVHKVGDGVTKFKKGDRVIAHTVNLVNGNPTHGSFARFCVVPVSTTAILPNSIPFESGAVVPLALDAAIAGLCNITPGEAMPGVPIPTMSLPLPSLTPKSAGRSLLVYGGSSAAGLMAIQVAVASGATVFATSSPKNFDIVKSVGATSVFDYKSDTLVDDIIHAVTDQGHEFVGIFDAIATPETFPHDLEILNKLGGKHLACSHPPPTEGLPEDVKAGMLFCINEASHSTWEAFVTPALESGAIKCLPSPTVIGHGLEFIQEALERSKAGVSATKLIVTL